MDIILASSSLTRKELLSRLQIPFEIYSPDIDETPLLNEKPEEIAKRLAKTKAETAAKKFPNHLIISADQVIFCDEHRLDKPGTSENAIQQLTLVSEKKIESFTALGLLNSKTNHYQSGIETYEVEFRKLTPHTIREYVKRDNPLHCAGSIKAEGIGITLFTKMSGRDPTALLGLPLMLLTTFLENEGVLIL